MKIAFLGNCQLGQIGMLMNELIKNKQLDHQVLWWQPVHSLSQAHYIPLFNALNNADVIYAQYYDEYWGMFSSKRLQKYFDKIKFVPVLESVVSSPQLGYWSKGTPPFGGYIDFRMLHLYCKNIPIRYAADMYPEIEPNMKVVHKKIDESVLKYKKYYDDGWVCFDYSERYKAAVTECFITINHPKNNELIWLMNCILSDLRIGTIFIQCHELLWQYQPPSLCREQNRTFYHTRTALYS